ncbi:MAG: DUF3604 domain-containing protein, partial [Holophagales bacterium]|nr:DUF3604 domain-containing protein [Holophagales bacterium]
MKSSNVGQRDLGRRVRAARFIAPYLLASWLGIGGITACGPGPDPERGGGEGTEQAPEHPSRWEVVEALRADLEAERHPADGGGTAWIELPEPGAGGDGLPEVPSGQPARFEVVYRAGPLGIAEGGVLFLQVSPFWGWSTPQVERPDAAGYTEVTTAASGVVLDAATADQQLLAIRIQGRGLREGEEGRILYGAGPAGAMADRYAETGERLWLAVDGDGDGVRRLLEESPRLRVRAGPAARLSAILPSTARPGEEIRLHLAVLDRRGNAGLPFEGELRLEGDLPFELVGEGVGGGVVAFEARHRGVRQVGLIAGQTGVLRLRVTGPAALATVSNPVQVAPEALGVFWGDLQIHSNLSDGTASPEELYTYGRDVAGLDLMSVTDHDHWGLRFLDASPTVWSHIQAVTERFHEPGRFVTVRGYEWTSWVHGHRHVLLFDDGPLSLYSSIDPAFDHPEELWAALRGRRALTVAHHSAGGPIATDWRIPPDPELETVTEIVSVHGSSEAADSPKPIYRPVAGNHVREAALGRGYRLGFVGSTDGHDGHPGLGHLETGVGGLAAILAGDGEWGGLDREGIYRAL